MKAIILIKMAKQIIRLDGRQLGRIVMESVKETLRNRLDEGGVHWRENVPDAIIQDIEGNFGNHSITPMDSSWYVVAIDGKYGFYEIDVPANGHNRIKMYKVNSHGRNEDDQWLYDDSNWFGMCEEFSQQDEPSMDRHVSSLNEDWDDDYGDDGLDDYTNELLRSMEKKDKAASKNDSDSGGKKVDKGFVRNLFNIDMGSLFDYDIPEESEEDEDDEIQPVNAGGSNNELFDSAMEAMETTNGTISFEEWFEEFGGDVNRVEAKTAFESAKKEYESYDEEDASEFSDREMNTSDSATQSQEHKAGNVLEYDGVKITDDGRQFTMVAKENDPQITIKGSNLEEVENTYNRLWNNYSNMEQLARNIGYTVYHGAWLLAKDYDKFVRAAGAHEENLPVLIDLDKDKAEESWIERYKQPNGKYQMTTYQLSQLPDEQRQQWEKLSRSNPNKYSIYAKSANKLNK